MTRAITMAALAFGALILAGPTSAGAEEPQTFELAIKGQAFVPGEIHVTAGKPFILKLKNENDAPVELEGKELKIEKVVAGKSEIVFRVRGMKAGRYLFVDEYQEDVAKGFVIAK